LQKKGASDFSDAPEIEKAFEEALRVLRRAGMKIARAELPDRPFEEITVTLLTAEEAAAHEEFIKSERLDELVDAAQKEGLKKSLDANAVALVRAQQQRVQITREVLQLFNKFDALISPSLLSEATTIETDLSTAFSKRGGFSVLGALCGVPSLTMPMGIGRHGLPLGLSLIGNLFDENTILQIGMIYQRETDWHRRRPPAL